MPILTADDFRKIPYARYKWIHFEVSALAWDFSCRTNNIQLRGFYSQARNVIETKQMIDSILEWNVKHPDQRIVVSIELENRTEKNLALVKDADYVFLSKDYSEFMGWKSKEVAIHNLRKYVKKQYVDLNMITFFDQMNMWLWKYCFYRAKLICPWGAEGAIAIDNETDSHFAASAKPPAKVVDSLGAGDTFLASTIHMLANGASIQESIEFGCQIAGAKIGFIGYDSIGSLI